MFAGQLLHGIAEARSLQRSRLVKSGVAGLGSPVALPSRLADKLPHALLVARTQVQTRIHVCRDERILTTFIAERQSVTCGWRSQHDALRISATRSGSRHNSMDLEMCLQTFCESAWREKTGWGPFRCGACTLYQAHSDGLQSDTTLQVLSLYASSRRETQERCTTCAYTQSCPTIATPCAIDTLQPPSIGPARPSGLAYK